MKDRRRLGSDDLVEAFTEMSLIELSEFVKQFEDVFGVTAAAPVAVAAAPAAASDPGAFTATDEGEYYIAIASFGEKKINVIKEVRALTKLGLKESKDLVESGGRVGAFAGQKAARRAIEALEGAGAVVVILGEGGGHQHVGSDLDRNAGNEELLQVVRARLESMLSPAEVTRVLDAGEQTLKEWLEAPRSSDSTVGHRLTGLLDVAAGFTQMWDEDLFADWLFAPNAHLDGATPADLIMLDRSSIALMALDEAAFGIYA